MGQNPTNRVSNLLQPENVNHLPKERFCVYLQHHWKSCWTMFFPDSNKLNKTINPPKNALNPSCESSSLSRRRRCRSLSLNEVALPSPRLRWLGSLVVLTRKEKKMRPPKNWQWHNEPHVTTLFWISDARGWFCWWFFFVYQRLYYYSLYPWTLKTHGKMEVFWTLRNMGVIN